MSAPSFSIIVFGAQIMLCLMLHTFLYKKYSLRCNKCNVLSAYHKILAVAVIINFPQILTHCYLHRAFIAPTGAPELT